MAHANNNFGAKIGKKSAEIAMAGRTLSLLAALLAVRADLDITNLAPEALDLTSIDAGLVGWLNSCSDGTHLYLCPRGSIGNPNLARVLLSDFSTVEHFDLSTASLNSDWGACFVDAAAGHVYYVPQTGNYAMRISTSSFQLSGSARLPTASSTRSRFATTPTAGSRCSRTSTTTT